MLSKRMLKFGCVALAIGLVLPMGARASETAGSISGYVRSVSGVPQTGAVVEVFGSALETLKVFTDERGFYSAGGLHPGFYSVRVSAPSFLTSEHERVTLHAGAVMILNVTLNTLFDSIQLAPMRAASDDDDWKWVLRSSANRSILRALDPGMTTARIESNPANHDFKGSLAFVAGSPSEGFGSASDMTTDFSVERSVFSSGTISLDGNVGYGETSPATVLRASYRRSMANGSQPQVALTFRNLESPTLSGAALQALALTTSDNLTLGNLELRYGSELQTIQFMGRVSAFRPFGTADFHVSPDTVVEYRYATSEPDTWMEIGGDSASGGQDLQESAPRMSIAKFSPALEHAHHQEGSLSHRMGKNSVQFAVYSDRISDPALTGVGEFSGDGGQVLPDIFSGTFTYRGRDLQTHGARVVFERKLRNDVTATLDYSYGGVLDLASSNVTVADADQLTVTHYRHSARVKMSGTIPGAKSRWLASYGWVSGQALTPVDMFNASAGRGDPYLDVFFRQPIPAGFIPGHMEAMVEVRNLLAQGYIPILASDGQTIYLVQAARSVRGGLAFSF